MALSSMWMIQWLLASADCLAAGLLVWLMLNGAARVWPALGTRRAVWLAAQGVVAIAALQPFLPRAQIAIAPQIIITPQISVAPQITSAPQAALEPVPATVPASTSADLEPAADRTQSAADISSRILPLLAATWLTIYVAGLAWTVARQLRANRIWRALLSTSSRLSATELRVHGGFSEQQLDQIARHKLTVLHTDAAISPMLIGVLRPRLLLPARLDALSTEQQQMVIAHELRHWRASDPLCLAIAAALQTIFWFNRPLRWMAKQMEWALELSCDQHVLSGRPQQQRKQYAAALLQQWTCITPVGAAAFGGTANNTTVAARIRHMQQEGLPALSAAIAWAIAAVLTAVLLLAALLQPALAFGVPAHTEVAATPAAAQEEWRAPLDQVRVTSFFGVQRSILPTPHKGIDFAAAKGTPVHATASGTVIAAGQIAENDGRYGNTVIIDHGAQRSLYAHLDSVSVTPGQHVQAGQLIGAVGRTGFATGPHLHLEVRQNGQAIDPASMLANLDAHATPRALKVRRQQKG